MGPFAHEVEVDVGGTLFLLVEGTVEYVETDVDEETGYAMSHKCVVEITHVTELYDGHDVKVEGAKLAALLAEHGDFLKGELRDSYEARCEKAHEDYAERARYYHR